MKSLGSCWVLLVKAMEDRRGLITNLRRCVKTKGSLKEHISIKRHFQQLEGKKKIAEDKAQDLVPRAGRDHLVLNP